MTHFNAFLLSILSQKHHIKVVTKCSSIFNKPGYTKTIMILASMCVLYKFYLHNKIETVCMVVLVVGSESSQKWVRVVSGLGPSRLGPKSTKGPSCLGSELSGYLQKYSSLKLWTDDDGRRRRRTTDACLSYKLTCEPSARVS